MKLTESQIQAVEHRGRNLQLIACAGSGKTEVVARRVIHLLTPGRSDSLVPGNIIAFTFTEKAAAEVKERIVTRTRQALGDIPGMAEMFVGTIHAFCLELLKSESPKHLKFEVRRDGFSPSAQDILESFEIRDQLPRASRANALGTLIEQQLSPYLNLISNLLLDGDGSVKYPRLDKRSMDMVFEDLVRRFSEESNEEAGEGGTQVAPNFYDQEINPETYASCKADRLLKSEGDTADNISHGQEHATRANDAISSCEFDGMHIYGKNLRSDYVRITTGSEQ